MRLIDSSLGIAFASAVTVLTLAQAAAANGLPAWQELRGLCRDEPATCFNLFRDLVSNGTLDQDSDGVPDLSDRCPGTKTQLPRGVGLLLDQDRVLSRLVNLLVRTRELLIMGANGATNAEMRELLALEITALFDEALYLANLEAEGRYLFGGAVIERPPFATAGEFHGDLAPEILYYGDSSVLEIPIGAGGDRVAVTTPGSVVFLGDTDRDGLYPDAHATDLFGLLIDAYLAFISNDQSGVATLLDEVDPATRNLVELRMRANATVRRLRLHAEFAGPPGKPVDANGCSQDQFCGRIAIENKRGGRVCARSDFSNDEPLRANPRDCRVTFDEKRRTPRCTSRRD